MILLPGSLLRDRATLAALCEGMGEYPLLARRLQSWVGEPYFGSWSDAEREAKQLTGDLLDGVRLRSRAQGLAGSAVLEPQVGVVMFAVATPLHAALGLSDLTAMDPVELLLSVDDSRALCEAADAHLHQDGVRVAFVDVDQWLVSCIQPIAVLTERPDWLVGEPLRPNLPRGKDARLVERWMNELQMLLFTHPVNIAREDRGLPPINVVWLWGFGDARQPLPLLTSDSSASKTAPIHHLRALGYGDVAAWQQTWADVSETVLTADTLVLGDSRPRLRLKPHAPTVASRFVSLFKRNPTLTEVLKTLQRQL